MKEIDKKSILIGYKLKQIRLNKGYTQAKIAEILGVSAQHYGTLERGSNSFSLDNILKLCDFYNVSVMSVLGELRQKDRKTKKDCEKLVSQIEELEDEHKEVVIHMVKFYRQLEKKMEKEGTSKRKLIETNGIKGLKTYDSQDDFDNEDDSQLAELIESLENEIRQKEAEELLKEENRKVMEKNN